MLSLLRILTIIITVLGPDDLEILFEKLTLYAARWDVIATHLSFKQPELKKIRAMPGLFEGAPSSWLKEMLTQWLQQKPGDKRGTTDYPTLENLKLALDKTGLAAFAANLSLKK